MKGYLDKQRLALQAEVADLVGADHQRQPRPQAAIAEPTAAERELRESTHWPYKPWCDHCLAMRGVEDRRQAIPDAKDRACPVVSFDYCYTGVSGNDANAAASEKLTVLVAHDTATGSVMGLRVASKGGADLKFAAVELTRFIQSLSHNTIELQCDSEPSTLSLQNLVVGVRTKLGFQTKVRNVAVGSHASTGNVEKSVDLIRGLSNVLLDQATT